MLVWEKLGHVFDPTQHRTSWMHHYSQNPNVLELDTCLRVFFTCRPERDAQGNCVSVTSYVDLEKKPPFAFIKTAPKPVLELGGPGDFDEFGIMPGSLIRMENGDIYLYYVGWTRMSSVPYKWTIGLAISKDNGESFVKAGKGPIISSTIDDPYLQACPRVMRVENGELLMYYQSGVEWNKHHDHFESVYITRVARSKDGINWEKGKTDVIPGRVEKECQTSASFIRFGGMNHVFFSYRHGIDFRNKDKGYRIGYAQGNDYENWQRKDDLNLFDVSESGWDAEMVCYPHVVELEGDIYMFYCGNNFGQNGFGVAKLKQ